MEKNYNTKKIITPLLICAFIGILSENALNITLSTLMEAFKISASTAQWLTTGFLLVLGILSPINGTLLQKFTTRQLFTTALISSITGTFLAAVGFNFQVLMIARIFQAIGIGILMPLVYTTVLFIYPQERRGSALGMVSLIYMFAPALGPSLAGIIVQYFSWHYIFWFPLPFLIVGFLFGLKYIENVRTTAKVKIDSLSVFLSTIGFGGIVYGVSKAGEESVGWTGTPVLITVSIGLIFLIAFIIRQLSIEQPLLNLKVFKYPMFIVGILIALVSMMIFMSTMIILPMYLQNKNGLNFSTLVAGLIMLPGSAINGILSPRMGKFYDKYGPRVLVIPGLILMCVMLFLLSFISITTSVFIIILLHIGLMIGSAMVSMPAQTNGINQLPQELYTHGTAVTNTIQQIGGALGTSISVSILANGMKNYLTHSTMPTLNSELIKAMATGSHNVFIYSMTIALLGLTASSFIRNSKLLKV